jgi:ankyrin repeat protein
MKPAKVKELVLRGADVNAQPDIFGTLPLQWASQLGQKDVVRLLLQQGAASQGDGSPLYATLCSMNPKLEKTGDAYMKLTDSCTRSGGADTALHHAAFFGNLESVKQLLAWGADPGAQNSQGISAKEAARRMERVDVVQFLEGAEANQAKGIEPVPLSPSYIDSLKRRDVN